MSPALKPYDLNEGVLIDEYMGLEGTKKERGSELSKKRLKLLSVDTG